MSEKDLRLCKNREKMAGGFRNGDGRQMYCDLCLDSAMDNYPTYRLLKKRGIRAFIDLNDKCGRPKTIPDTITIDKDGTPLCQEKLRMKPNG